MAKENLALIGSTITYHRIRLFYPGVKLGQNVRFYGPILLRISRTATVHIGDNVTFRSSTSYNFVGINRPVSIYVGDQATLNIGHNCGFSGTAIFATSSIQIGSYSNFGGNSSLWDTDFHPLDYRLRRVQLEGTRTSPIKIGEDAFIGANVLILKGVTIGSRSIVGAGSVVSKDIPADQIWAGNPAQFIRYTSSASVDYNANSSQLEVLPA
jgi:acetyltransferase-like isoleucine patch superfamily enzyme